MIQINGSCKLLVLVNLGIGLIGSIVLGQELPEPTGRQGPALVVAKQSPEEIAGTFRAEGREAEFFSRTGAKRQVILRVSFLDVLLDAEADLEHDTRTIDGHDRALSAEEREFLRKFSAELEQNLKPYTRTLPTHADLLFRTVSYWADAPVG